jgi:hypothetical protein
MWKLYDVQGVMIGASCLFFGSKVDAFLNAAAHGAIPEASIEYADE